MTAIILTVAILSVVGLGIAALGGGPIFEPLPRPPRASVTPPEGREDAIRRAEQHLQQLRIDRALKQMRRVAPMSGPDQQFMQAQEDRLLRCAAELRAQADSLAGKV